MISHLATGGPFMDFRRGANGSGGLYVDYIVRPEATLADRIYPAFPSNRLEYPVWARNLPEDLLLHAAPHEQGFILRTYVEQDARWERALHRGARRRPLEYFRVTASFATGIRPTIREMQEIVEDYLSRDFARARVIASVHRNTGNFHVNLCILARDVDGRKLALGQRYFRQDQQWAKVYLRHTEPDREVRLAKYRLHLRKKAETLRFTASVKTLIGRERARGHQLSWREAEDMIVQVSPKPLRYADYRNMELHPHARHAAELAQRIHRAAHLMRLAARYPRAEEAGAWHAEWKILMRQGPAVMEKQLTDLIRVYRSDAVFMAQVERLAGAESLQHALTLRRVKEGIVLGR